MAFIAGLFGAGKSRTTAPVAASGLQFQTSTQGMPVQIVYGTTRIAPNLIWYGDFLSIAHQSTAGSGGGKGGVGGGGGGKGGGGTTSYTYQAAVALGLCEGPITGVPTTYVDKNVTTPSALGMSIFTGGYSQAPWGYLTTNHPGQDLNYHGIAYLAASAYQLGNSPQLPNHNFEVQGVLYATAPSGGGDADPSQVINDLLTNSHYGAAFPPARVGSLTTYQAYTLASGLWVSPAYNQQAQASAILDDLATATNSAFVWSSGLLTLVPYGDQNITAHGYTYTAPSAPVYDLTDDDFLPNTNATGSSASNNQDPVLLTRKRPADAINSIKLECLDRGNSYNPSVIEAKDQALIDVFGLRQSPSKQTHLFCDLNAGRLSAQLQLQRQAIRNVYSFTLDQRYVLLDPMDIVTLTDSALGLNRQWVRILEITENDDGSLSMTAEEYLSGTGSAPLYSFQANSGFSADYNSSPGNANAPVIFEPPVQITTTGLETWLATSGGSNWGGCDVWVSTDGSTYKNAGRITGPSRQGVLTATLPSGFDPDTSNTLSVNLSESFGQLLSGTQADADGFHTLCYVDGEIVSYETATLTSAYHYDLTYLRRGAYGTTISSHSSGSPFVRLDNGVFTYSYDKSKIGQTLYVKLVSFNIYGGGQQSISDVVVYTHTLVGPPKPPNVTGFQVQQKGDAVAFYWNEVQDGALKGYDILYGPQGGTLANATFLTESLRGTEMTNASVPPGTWTFYIRARDIADQFSVNAATANLVIVNNDMEIISEVQEPDWAGQWTSDGGHGTGTLSGFVQHYTGVLVPRGQNPSSNYVQISAPAAPTLGSIAGGALTGATYYVKLTYVLIYSDGSTSETTPSSESSKAVASNNLLTVASPSDPSVLYALPYYNVYAGTSSGAETLQNASPIPINASWTLPVAGLVAGTSPPTTNETGWEVFDIFVVDVTSQALYITPTYDTGFNDTLRVWSTIGTKMGPGQSGTPNPQLMIDTWLTGMTDPATYTPWIIGTVEMRYLRGMLFLFPISQGEVYYITDFTLNADRAPLVQNGGNVVISPGGTTITFAQPYHIIPYVTATVVSNMALTATAVNITTTQCTFHVWDHTGTDVGGTINYTSSGE